MKVFPPRPRNQLLFPLDRLLLRGKSPSSLLKWVGIGLSIGIVAGVGAITFEAAIRLVTGFFLGTMVGYLPPSPVGEGPARVLSLWATARPWLLPVVTTLGGLLVGLIVCSLAPEAEGHGTDAAIAAFHQGKPVRARIPLVKLVASALTLGTGGSAGQEGPAAHIGAGFGSILARLFRLQVQDQRMAMAIGIGAGIGSIFHAPLGGAILAAEILYTDDLEVEALIPALIASTVGSSIVSLWSGGSPMLGTVTASMSPFPFSLFYAALIGILCGLLGRLYAWGFYGMTQVFHRLPLPLWIKPAIGGLLVGLLGLALPQILGMGDGWIQFSMGSGLLTLPFWLLLVLPLAKILTTGLSIGSGGSGGIFGPGMVIGALAGALIWRVGYQVLPELPALPAPFVVVGMMALLGGITRAPLAAMVMGAEMTGNLSLLVPAMLAVSLSYWLVGKQTLYLSQLETRSDSPAHQLQSPSPLLSPSTVPPGHDSSSGPVERESGFAEAKTGRVVQNLPGTPILEKQQRFIGVPTRTALELLQRQNGPGSASGQ